MKIKTSKITSLYTLVALFNLSFFLSLFLVGGGNLGCFGLGFLYTYGLLVFSRGISKYNNIHDMNALTPLFFVLI